MVVLYQLISNPLGLEASKWEGQNKMVEPVPQSFTKPQLYLYDTGDYCFWDPVYNTLEYS